MTGTPLDRKKLVVVGDGACGKTCLLIRFAEGTFNPEYIPTIFENRASKITVDNTELELTLWDTAGQEAYEVIRPLAYKDADIILICYSIESPESLKNVSEVWIQEIRHYCPTCPIILVGNKSDLKNSSNAVRTEEAKKVSEEIKAQGFLECSALEGDNVHEIFVRAATLAMQNKAERKNCCAII